MNHSEKTATASVSEKTSAHNGEGDFPRLRLFVLGFMTLFMELALIRYLAGNIWNMGYFPNFVLMAVFIGMGSGFIFHGKLSDKGSTGGFVTSFILLLALIAFVYYAHPSIPGFRGEQTVIAGELFFTNVADTGRGESYFALPACFALVILIFALLSQRTAKVFRLLRPLTAYSLDIGGSCMGILSFMLLSWRQAPPWVWFLIVAIAAPLAMSSRWSIRAIPAVLCCVVAFYAHVQDETLVTYSDYHGDFKVFWSPYQKIEKVGGVIFVNGVGHQVMQTNEQIQDSFYSRPYVVRNESGSLPPYRRVLILGAGSGNDVSAALFGGAKNIDAVEIDPVIAKLGKLYHPVRPYEKPGVNLVIDDGRAFLTRARGKYDLIVFALTDSVVRASSQSQLRLENFLFTKEAVWRAFRLLNDNGDIIFYNQYRQPWLVDKIAAMIEAATGRKARRYNESKPPSYFAVIGVNKSDPEVRASEPVYDVPTDDWPFLYLKERSVPGLYKLVIAGMFALVGTLMLLFHLSTRKIEGPGGVRIIFVKIAFVFMGMAFMLLETKSVIQFSLLFGTTWVNNSLVFLGILVLILLANYAAYFVRSRHVLWGVYFLLIASSLTALVYPLGRLLDIESGVSRFIIASMLTFSPIFFANLIFGITFRDQPVAEQIFGWNLTGATIGGILEYGSMAFGYDMLAVLVALCYTAVLVFLYISGYLNPSRSPRGEGTVEKVA